MASVTNKFLVVIEKHDKENNKDITELDICNYLRSKEDDVKYWAFILHDKDLNDDGVLERSHYHIVLVLNDKLGKTSVQMGFVKALMINTNCVGVRKCLDVVKSTQYLIHQNDKDKFQYDLLDIWTNDVNEMMSILFNNVSSYEIDIDYLIKLTENCKSLKQIYKQLGLIKSKEYRSLVIDLWKERFRD